MVNGYVPPEEVAYAQQYGWSVPQPTIQQAVITPQAGEQKTSLTPSLFGTIAGFELPGAELVANMFGAEHGIASGALPLSGTSWMNIAKIAGLSSVAGGLTSKIASSVQNSQPGEDSTSMLARIGGTFSQLPDWAKTLLGAGAGAATAAGIMSAVGGNGEGGEVAGIAAIFGDIPISSWNTNPSAPEYGHTFYRLASGKIGTITKTGMVRKWRPAKHIVISRNPGVRELLRADKRVTRLLKGLRKAVKNA